MHIDCGIFIGGTTQDGANQPWRKFLKHLHGGNCIFMFVFLLICVSLTTEQQQVFIHGLLYLRVSGQRTARAHAEAIGRFRLGYAIIANTLVDDYSSRLLGEHLPRPVVAV